MFRASAICLGLALIAIACDKPAPAAPEKPATALPRLDSVGPRVIANDSTTHIYLYGENFVDGMQLQVADAKVPVTRISSTLGSAQLGSVDVPDERSVLSIPVQLHAPAGAIGEMPVVRIVNDTDYPIPWDFAVADGAAFVVSPTTDTVWKYTPDAPPTAIKVGNRPRDIAVWSTDTTERVVVLHELQNELWSFDPARPDDVTKIEIPEQGQTLTIEGDRAYVANRLTDAVHVIDLRSQKEVAKWPTGVNPRAVAVGAGKVAVANIGGDDMVIVDAASGAVTPVVVGPGAKIVGGRTQRNSKYVMGLKAPRDLVWSAKHDVFLAATIGPNVGPNADKTGVSMNSGVSVVAPDGTFLHHVSMRRGNAERIALDEAAGIILAADISRGRVVAMDLDSVVAGLESVVAQYFVEPPANTKLLRSAEDYGVEKRATTSMYSGPAAIELGAGGVAYVLNRFTGTINEVGYDRAARKVTFATRRVWPGPDLGMQTLRRGGEVIFSTDFGDSRMSCDGCHYEGHNQGTLFTKSSPMHIYRVTSLRSISETAPYFTPAKFPTLARISHFVAGGNRLQNLPPNTAEVSALVAYQRALAPPANPHAGKAEVTLPDGTKGKPAAGYEVFAANCVGCHPPPMFTPDQDVESRGKTYPTGTVTIDLRPEMQDATAYDVPVPTLVGVWDNHPLFHGGQKGNEVQGDRLVTRPFALKDVLDDASHFDASKLTAQQRQDLLAFVLTL